MLEQWRDVVGWEGVYQVSDAGNVRRTKMSRGSRTGRSLGWKRKDGYRMVVLSDGDRREDHRIHRLVASAFIGPLPEGQEVNHKDGDRGNNRVTNLEYVTRADNNLHAFRVLKRRPNFKVGSDHGRAVVSEDTVRLIRDRYATEDVTQQQLGEEYGLDQTTVSLIVRRKLWRHV